MSALTIASTRVNQDKSGRYSLNDLHRAAGGEKRHAPNEWLRNSQAQELVEELCKPGNPGLASEGMVTPVEVRKGGAAPGTYVCKEMVYAYAMWISPRFNLHVIRAFDALTTGKAANDQPPPDRQLSVANREFKAALSLARAAGLKGNQAALSADRAVSRTLGLSPLRLIGAEGLEAAERLCTATELGKECGVSAQQMNVVLEDCGYQKRSRDAKNALIWQPTPLGAPFAVLLDTGKAHNGGAPVQQLKWKVNILGHVAAQLKRR